MEIHRLTMPHALQQLLASFDHLIGAGEQSRRDGEAERQRER
jgi:hypothetical protein